MRIKKLSALVASQIAAGEVIERPASVLKELLENSIDAASSAIDVEVINGGLQLICVRDNGCGIYQEDLELALMQHATSKISEVADLAAINSLGFRGEALASIAAVSKLFLTSKPKMQALAWEFNAVQNNIQPAALNGGTCIRVENLFYNLPVRRKFLRSEHTEFNYLEDLFKRVALSHFDIAFSLTHNGKKIKLLPACTNTEASAKRLAVLCGKRMLEQSIYIDVEQNGMRLSGWLGLPIDARSHSENQFFYLNQRMVKDRLINHAIKQAYQAYTDPGRYPTYCLYFSLDVETLDVNVHPTKHEVRFRDPRIVHAFLTKVIQEALAQRVAGQTAAKLTMQQNFYQSIPLKMVARNLDADVFIPTASAQDNIAAVAALAETIGLPADFLDSTTVASDNRAVSTDSGQPVVAAPDIKLLCVIGDNKLVLAQDQGKILLVDVAASKSKLLINAFEQLFLQQTIIPARALLMPKPISLRQDVASIMQYTNLFASLGFKLEQIGLTDLLIRAVPAPLSNLECEYQLLFLALAKLFKSFSPVTAATALATVDFAKCIDLLVTHVHYPAVLSTKEALQLVIDLKNLAPARPYKGEKLTFKQCSLNDLQDFVYRY